MSTVSTPLVLVLGGGPGQLGLIRELRDRGCEIVVVDRDPHVPGAGSASLVLQCSTHDGEAIVTMLEGLSIAAGIEAIVCPSTGAPYLAAARCATTLGLHFPPEAAVVGILDKYELWCALQKIEGTRRWCVPADEKHVHDRLPCVVKPRRGGGASVGVTFCRSQEELRWAVECAESSSYGEADAIVESLCEGHEYKLAGAVQGGEVKLLLVGRRTFGRQESACGIPIAIALGPSEDPRVDGLHDVAGLVEALCRQLELDDVPLNIDIIDTTDGPEIIDCDIVFGSFERLARGSFGLDLCGVHADLCLRRPLSVTPSEHRGAAATYLWFEGDASRMLLEGCRWAASGLEEFVADPWLREGGGSNNASPVERSGVFRAGCCISEGATQEEALREGVQWLSRVEEWMVEHGAAFTVVRPEL